MSDRGPLSGESEAAKPDEEPPPRRVPPALSEQLVAAERGAGSEQSSHSGLWEPTLTRLGARGYGTCPSLGACVPCMGGRMHSCGFFPSPKLRTNFGVVPPHAAPASRARARASPTTRSCWWRMRRQAIVESACRRDIASQRGRGRRRLPVVHQGESSLSAAVTSRIALFLCSPNAVRCYDVPVAFSNPSPSASST